MGQLGDIIEREKALLGSPDRPLSNRRLSALTEDIDDGPVHHTTIGNWIRGVYGDVDPELISVMARAIARAKYRDQPERQKRHAHELAREMRRAAGLPLGGEHTAIDIPEVELLDVADVRLVEDIVRRLARARRTDRPATEA